LSNVPISAIGQAPRRRNRGRSQGRKRSRSQGKRTRKAWTPRHYSRAWKCGARKPFTQATKPTPHRTLKSPAGILRWQCAAHRLDL